MFKKLAALEWKLFTRSSSFKVNLFMKILLAFTVLYFTLGALMLGIGIYFIIEEELPNQSPLVVVCKYLIIWFVGELLFRFFMQKLPVLNIKPFMSVPIKRNTIIKYLIGKTVVSPFNLLPVFFFLPFTIILLLEGYGINAVFWFLAMGGLTFCNNFLNFFTQKSSVVFYLILGLVVTFIALAWWDIFDVFPYTGQFFYAMYEYPFVFLLPIISAVILCQMVFIYLRKNFYLDEAIQRKGSEAQKMELSFLNRFGKLAIFLKNDIRMILRNARPKQVLWTSFFFLFYGLFFFTQESYRNNTAFLPFISMFITSGFLITFGQLVPSWDSQYYKLLMSQNISYRKYLESKWWLMVLATFVSLILVTPYLYFGWDIYLMILAAAIFNIGLNSFITLLGGALNRIPVDLEVKRKAFGNTQGFNPTQLLIALPKMLGPVVIFFIPYLIWGYNAGLIALAISGIIGLLLKDFFLNKIVNIYKKGKYKTIAAFSEKN